MSAEYRVFTVGRDDPVKNIATTIEATRILSGRVNSLAHVLVGPGTEKIAFDGVHLGLGSVTEEMIAAYSNWCNCFLQVQLVSDLGMAASEALMVGRPVVVTGDPSGNAQYLIDEDRGVIVPIEKVKDAQFVTEALDMCLHRQYDYDAIRKWAIERYDAEKLKKEEANRYRKLIGTTSEKTREEHLETIRRRIVLLSMWMELTSSEVKRLIPALIAFPSRIARAAGRRLRRTWWRVA